MPTFAAAEPSVARSAGRDRNGPREAATATLLHPGLGMARSPRPPLAPLYQGRAFFANDRPSVPALGRGNVACAPPRLHSET